MIESPKDQSERLHNFVKRAAQELRAVHDALGSKVSQTVADTLYLGKTGKAESAKTADSAKTASAVAWENVTGKPISECASYGETRDRDSTKPTYGLE